MKNWTIDDHIQHGQDLAIFICAGKMPSKQPHFAPESAAVYLSGEENTHVFWRWLEAWNSMHEHQIITKGRSVDLNSLTYAFYLKSLIPS